MILILHSGCFLGYDFLQKYPKAEECSLVVVNLCIVLLMSLLFVLLLALVLMCPMIGANTNTKEPGHVVLITSPFFGHIIPLLDLAKRLSIHHHVSYIVSASKLHALKQRGLLDETSTSSQSRLHIVGLFDNNDEDIEVSSMI